MTSAAQRAKGWGALVPFDIEARRKELEESTR